MLLSKGPVRKIPKKIYKKLKCKLKNSEVWKINAHKSDPLKWQNFSFSFRYKQQKNQKIFQDFLMLPLTSVETCKSGGRK